MLCLAVEGLPEASLAAAADFYTRIAPQASGVAGDVLLVFPPADHTHRAWRLAAVQALAREAVPYRVNAVEGAGAPVEAVRAFLAQAAGVTGQLLALDGQGAGVVLD